MGKQGIWGGKVAVSQCTSLCGMVQDGKGHSWTLHRKYLLPISPNLEQAGDDTPVAGVEQTKTSAPETPVDSEPANVEPSGMATSDMTGNMSQGSQDQPVPLRCSTCTTQNQIPWHYHNFALSADVSPLSNLDAWVGLCICLNLISCLYTIFVESIV